jgi:hypothetical protein
MASPRNESKAMRTTFEGEVQFVTYADSSRGGPRITFRLADRDELERFIGMEGKRLACVLVEIADDETAAEPAQAPAPVQEPTKALGPLSKWCVLRCKEPAFQAWCGATDEAGARAWVLATLGITSRRAIDDLPPRFHTMVRLPYLEHCAMAAA